MDRLHSLDAFRGATIALMVIVNTAGDHSYAPLKHASGTDGPSRTSSSRPSCGSSAWP